MPFKIIRNDITRVKADAIVNTANPKPIYSNGTDGAIYQAAGAEGLLAERQKIGDIARGNVAITGAYKLPAKYIIHTVGPVWEDGEHGEFDILRSCYGNSLEKAAELGCESIAFPLISTGVYGFPKDKALQIAISTFSEFLSDHEMQIILVVFDKKSYQLSSNIVGEIDAFIDANYVSKTANREYKGSFSAVPTRRHRRDEEPEIEDQELYERRCSKQLEEEIAEAEESEAMETYALMAPLEDGIGTIGATGLSLEDELENLGESFHDKLFDLIAEAGIDNKDVWKLANLDRKHFSKIQCDAKYHPKKKTVMALCIALKLDLDQAKDLMARADWAFSPSSKVDLIVQKAIIDKNYNINQLNMVLFEYTNEILGI